MTLPKANTQYNDLIGTVALDIHEGTGLQKLAESKKIDTKLYFPIGIEIDGVDLQSFTIIAVDLVDIHAKNFNDISSYAKAHHGEVPIIKFHFEDEWNNVRKYFKRLDVVAYRKMDGVSDVEIKKEIQLV